MHVFSQIFTSADRAFSEHCRWPPHISSARGWVWQQLGWFLPTQMTASTTNGCQTKGFSSTTQAFGEPESGKKLTSQEQLSTKEGKCPKGQFPNFPISLWDAWNAFLMKPHTASVGVSQPITTASFSVSLPHGLPPTSWNHLPDEQPTCTQVLVSGSAVSYGTISFICNKTHTKYTFYKDKINI